MYERAMYSSNKKDMDELPPSVIKGVQTYSIYQYCQKRVLEQERLKK